MEMIQVRAVPDDLKELVERVAALPAARYSPESGCEK
jgi:hypothetical protein